MLAPKPPARNSPVPSPPTFVGAAAPPPPPAEPAAAESSAAGARIADPGLTRATHASVRLFTFAALICLSALYRRPV